jgi:GAF domain-containing protein
LKVPVAAVTLINSSQQWFKSVAGWAVSEIPRENSLCTWTLQSGQATVIADTQTDDRTAEHPLVLGSPHFRFYAGVPLLDADHSIIGTFCVFDVKPRNLTTAELQSLTDLGALAQNE